MTDDDLIADFRAAFSSGCDYLLIHSRRQDVGLAKCQHGVRLGYLEFVEVAGEQETHYRYYWTDKARRAFA